MQTPQQKFSVSLHRADFEQLKAQYPHQADILETLAETLGPKTVIPETAFTPQILKKLDAKLIDHLYRLAYNLREEKFWSYYIQLSEILKLPKSRVRNILEIGKGQGIFESLISNFDYHYLTLDIKPEFAPDIRGNVLNLPIADRSIDLICAFEVLQHLPHSHFKSAIKELSRCARQFVFLSLPCPTSSIYFQFRANFLQRILRKMSSHVNLFYMLPFTLPDKNETQLLEREDTHNPHYWEVNRKSYSKRSVLAEIASCDLHVTKTFHNPYYAYHLFILCEVNNP